MTIKQQGGIFGRNPSFNDVEVNDLTSSTLDVRNNSKTGTLTIGTETATRPITVRAATAGLSLIDTASEDYAEVIAVDGSLILRSDQGNTASSSYIRFQVDGSEAARFNDSLNLVFPSGKGIDFSATAGTGTSELFDDYEEGTWTPTILFGTANVGMTFNIQAGKYTKVGNLVTASCFVALSLKGSSTGAAFVGGLPFASGNVANQNAPASLWVSAVSFADFLQGFNGVNASTISLREATNAGVQSSLSEGNFANNSSMMISVSYRV